MVREIRRVPPNWKHPRLKSREYSADWKEVLLQPMYDQHFDDVFADWLADFDHMRAGDLDEPERELYPRGLADWLNDGERPPDPACYRPWKDDEATWYQVWATEGADGQGTPITPPFATREELVEYLVNHATGQQDKMA
jgi:hypothetical protein